MAIADDAISAPVAPGPLATAAGVLGALQDLDLDALSATELNETVVAFQGLRARLEAAEARVLARWDADRCWQLDGARSGAAWIAWRNRLPIEVCRQRVRHARALRALPEVAAAWADAEVDRTHITSLLGACNPRTAARFAQDHPVLLEAARLKGFRDFRVICQRWANTVDPDGAEQSAADERAAREVHLAQSFGGMWFGKMTLDPISGTIMNETLSAIERELFEADWADAKQQLGREPLAMELARTPAQRRADALVEMATRARTAPKDGRRPAPLFTVLVGYETFAGPVLELYNRTIITPGTAAAHLDDAYIERVVFDSPSRVIDVGAQRRFFRGADRRAVLIRDRTCFHPTCDEIPDRPHIDHIHEWCDGGPTTQANGRPGCGFHNIDRWHRDHPGGPDTGPDPPDE